MTEPAHLRRDGQPDIVYGHDPLKWRVHEWRSRVDWLTRMIRIELDGYWHCQTEAHKARKRRWIVQAQADRRQALHNLRAYQAMVSEREMIRRVLP